MGIRNHKVLYNDSAEGTSEWFRLDSRYEIDPTRAIQVDMSNGDIIQIQGTTIDTRGPDKSFLDTITSADITTIEEFSDSGNGVIVGPFTYIRVNKTGTTGSAKVQGFI